MFLVTIFLGVVALAVPWVIEWLKRNWYAPKLIAVFREGLQTTTRLVKLDPMCRSISSASV